MDPSRRFLRLFAGAGVATCALGYPVWRGAWVTAIVSLAAVTIVPLGLSLSTSPKPSRSFRLAIALLPVGALGALGTWFLPTGFAGGAAASAWLATTLAIALTALLRLLGRGLEPLDDVAIDVGWLLLPVGAVWLVASRSGVSLLGFQEPIVLLTAAHFHYAGFAGPVILGATGRLLFAPGERSSVLYRIGTVTVCAAVPLTALGIATDRVLEAPAALVLASGMLVSSAVVGILGARRAVRSSKPAAALLALAGTTLLFTMSLAATFAVTGSAGRAISSLPLVSIPQMIELHGAPNAVLFALAGLIAHCLLDAPSRSPSERPTFSRLRGSPFVGPEFFDRIGARSDETCPGMIDDLAKFENVGFDPASVDPEIRRFYQRTGEYSFVAENEWRPPFGFLARLARPLLRHVGQLELAVGNAEADRRIESRCFRISDPTDGRSGVRAWIRTYASNGRAVMVAACAREECGGVPFLSVALPMPGFSIASIMRFQDGSRPAGLRLVTSTPSGRARSAEGLYWVSPLFAMRVPLAEALDLWPSDEPGVALSASYELRVLGLRALRIGYVIARSQMPVDMVS